MLLRLFVFVTALFIGGSLWAQQPAFFAVMSDPQFGMYAKDQNFEQEAANFEFAVANINRLRPAFVVICGDLVNRAGDPDEIAEYKRILAKVDRSIPVYSVAGNHDVGNVPTAETIQAFRRNIGRDYYSFNAGDVFGIVLNSNLIRAPEKDPDAAKEQEAWLTRTLKEAQTDSKRQIIVFQHIPYFIKAADEKDEYFNIPQPARRKYLELFRRAGVKYIFAGHYHQNAVATDGGLTEIVTGAVGMPIGKGAVSGFRIVVVRGKTLSYPWFCFGGIPNRIESGKPIETPCAQ